MAAPHPYGPHTREQLVQHFKALPHYPTKLYWDDWGPVFYRGRLDGSAKVLGVAQDPGVCEHVARRVLVGTAGQRVQFLLEKLGLCHAYVLVNAHQYEIRAGFQRPALRLVGEPIYTSWRNDFFDLITDAECLQAIVAFGEHARKAVSLWAPPQAAKVFNLKHPTSRNLGILAANWTSEFAKLKNVVTPDPGCSSSPPIFGKAFSRSHPARIPDRDLSE